MHQMTTSVDPLLWCGGTSIMGETEPIFCNKRNAYVVNYVHIWVHVIVYLQRVGRDFILKQDNAHPPSSACNTQCVLSDANINFNISFSVARRQFRLKPDRTLIRSAQTKPQIKFSGQCRKTLLGTDYLIVSQTGSGSV